MTLGSAGLAARATKLAWRRAYLYRLAMSEFLRDLRFGVRLLVKSPVFAITAALLLAIGISANTLIFSLINALLLRPLPVSHPENLVRVVEVHPNDFVTWMLPYKFCEVSASRDAELSEAICQGEADVGFSDGDSTERVRVHLVSPNFFSSLGVQPRLGRALTPEDERTGAPNAVLSYDFWQQKFQGNASVVGRKIVLSGHPFTIVGVSPKEFNGLTVDTSPAVRVPASADRFLVKMEPYARFLSGQVFGRLRNGVAFELAVGLALGSLVQGGQVERVPAQGGGEAGGGAVVTDHEGGLGVLEAVLQLGRAEPDRERDAGGTHLLDRQVQAGHRLAAGQQERHPVAAPDALAGQGPGQLVRAGVPLPPGQRPGAADREPARVPVRGPAEHPADVHDDPVRTSRLAS